MDVGKGPTALFVHGVGTSGYLWHNAIEQLYGEYRCVALDLPLHGNTPVAPGQDLSLRAHARVVHDLCDALELSGIHLVANDTGGAVSQIFAARHADRLATLALTNCETHDNVPPPAFKATVTLARIGLFAPATRWLANRPAAARQLMYRLGYEDPRTLTDEAIRAYLQPLLGTPQASREYQRWVASLHARDLLEVEPLLRELCVPTLVVWGTGDVFFPLRWAHWLRDTIPGVTEVVEIDGAKLFFPDERAPELVPHLRRHWAAHAHCRTVDPPAASPATGPS